MIVHFVSCISCCPHAE